MALVGPRAGSGIVVDFALFGALHAAALVGSISVDAGVSTLRRIAFIAAAGLLAALTVQLGMLGGRIAEPLGGGYAPTVLLAVSAGFGALAYALSIRVVLDRSPWGGGAGAWWLAAAALQCAAAATAGFWLARALHRTGLEWLVVPWWFAFSAGLAMPIRSQSR